MGRRLPAAALIVLAVAACGGHTAKTPPPPTAAESHWRSGLVKWGASMRSAIDGVSVIFSQPSSVRGVESGDRRTAVKLRRLENALSGCATAIQKLGEAPATFAVAHHQALRACAALQHGSALIRAGVRQVQHGLGFDLLTQSSDALATGQDGVRRALLDLKQG
jgi:hypothetical protein